MKSHKIYIIAGIILIVGIILFTGGFAMANFDTNKLNGTEKYQQLDYTVQTEIERIMTDDENVRVLLSASPDDKIHIIYFENNKNTYSISEDNGTLSVIKNDTSKWYDHIFVFNFPQKNVRLEIQIPDAMSPSLDINTANASVSADNIQTKDITLKTSNGKISVQNTRAEGNIEFRTNNGALNLANCYANGKINGESSNGAISLKNVTASDSIRITTSNAASLLKDVHADSLISIESSNGKITAETLVSSQKIRLQTSNGAVEIHDLTYNAELYVKTSNGAIKGDLNGSISDYSYECRTSNGKCSLPESGNFGEKKVVLKTSNGNIDVGFQNS